MLSKDCTPESQYERGQCQPQSRTSEQGPTRLENWVDLDMGLEFASEQKLSLWMSSEEKSGRTQHEHVREGQRTSAIKAYSDLAGDMGMNKKERS